ncbi:MAG: hypothetical protein H6Q04_11 [Acidobacteria bacterium]|jgi:hypothetical protein|nr:hypothetical protein [Acidobacteriota bacterium]
MDSPKSYHETEEKYAPHDLAALNRPGADSWDFAK